MKLRDAFRKLADRWLWDEDFTSDDAQQVSIALSERSVKTSLDIPTNERIIFFTCLEGKTIAASGHKVFDAGHLEIVLDSKEIIDLNDVIGWAQIPSDDDFQYADHFELLRNI